MPRFADNLSRMCHAAGIPLTEAARHLDATAAEVEGWLAAGALPELHVLVRLADAIGCRVDDLLAGDDDEFDHPQRRHAALIAARMGRVRILMSQVRLARHRREIGPGELAALGEASLLATVARCRAWVMSEAHDVGTAAAIEAELDVHAARASAVLARARQAATGVNPEAPVTQRNGTHPPTESIDPGSSEGGEAPEPDPAALAAAGAFASTHASTGRRVGHRSTLWAHDHADQQHECVMVTRASEVDVELRVDDRVLETRTCQTLDEALRQSSEWKRAYLAPAILALPELTR